MNQDFIKNVVIGMKYSKQCMKCLNKNIYDQN